MCVCVCVCVFETISLNNVCMESFEMKAVSPHIQTSCTVIYEYIMSLRQGVNLPKLCPKYNIYFICEMVVWQVG